MSVTCDHCGSIYAVATDRPDHVCIDCPACGMADFIWKDNEYEYEAEESEEKLEQDDLTLLLRRAFRWRKRGEG